MRDERDEKAETKREEKKPLSVILALAQQAMEADRKAREEARRQTDRRASSLEAQEGGGRPEPGQDA